MDPVTCHVLDTALGKPAAGVRCAIYRISLDATDGFEDLESGKPFAMAKTDADGRVKKWVIDPQLGDMAAALGIEKQTWLLLKPGIYKIKFYTHAYFQAKQGTTFFPYVDIVFHIGDPPDQHYHVPLLLSNHSYTTYRGS